MSTIITARPSSFQLPDPRLTPVYRLEATLGEPLDLGDTDHGHRRIVPLTAGTFAGPAIGGRLLPGASADCGSVGGRQPGGLVYETYLVE